ncbi:hypothetical protein LOH54_09325 [Sulfurimonas sp. HSL-3221]|uniref:hypothetical protein n=1 Tax=Thiomicrolovo sulfuroxydans TaxID=2894755 RepID=UPI001E5E2D4C|nr:hypothetical protein [Sulfurimonas sp. HSL-3221]UFS61855.1 hypothetical protein LOH54_09325 [Sulfurimonas sp. HSL-3221]
MQNLVSIYEENADLIQKFILASIQRIGLIHLTEKNVKHIFNVFPSLELAYETDEGFAQTSANYSRHKSDTAAVGADRSYLIDESKLVGDYYFHEPYLSTTTGHLCITIVYKTAKGGYILLDFQLRNLLERFMLIENNGGLKMTHRTLYGIIGGGLLLLGIFVVLYGLFSFGHYLIVEDVLSLEMFFKPVIALTLGLAVYDLGKTIVDQEVMPKTQKVDEGIKVKTLLNFSVSILIALMIEALLVVFKISISNYHDLPYAASLIGALALLFFVFSYFIYIVRKSGAAPEIE